MNARNFPSRLAERWAAHLEFIRGSLASEPQAPQAWRWQIRHRVVTYLLTRYGGDPRLDWRPAAPPIDTALSPRGERKTVEPRPASELGAHLRRIAEANDVPLPDRAALENELDRRATRRVATSAVAGASLLGFFTVLVYFWCKSETGDAAGFAIIAGMAAGVFTAVCGPMISRGAAWLLTRD